MLLNVAICTLDRPRTLARTLASLAEEQHADEVSVLVVDNSPTRSARSEWAAFRAILVGSTNYLPVAELGLSHACNAALGHVESRFLAFIDSWDGIDRRVLELYEQVIAPVGVAS